MSNTVYLPLYSIVALLLWVALGSCSVESIKEANLDEQLIREKLIRSRGFISSNQNDSAIIYLQPTLDSLKVTNSFNSILGLEVRLVVSKAQAQRNQNIEALFSVKELIEQSEIQEQWRIYAESCLILARLYHKIQRISLSKQQLILAGNAIQEHKLEAFLPEFTIHNALWHNTYGSADSVAYFAELAINALDTKADNSLVIQADYYTLQGILASQKNLEQSIAYFKKAAKFAKQSEDFEQLLFIFNEMSKQYGAYGKVEQTLVYSDSAIAAAYKAITNGNLYTSSILANVKMQRGIIFENIGQLDSALLYYKKGSAEQIRYLRDQENFRVKELDAKYYNQKQNLRLSEQDKEIETSRKIRLLLLGVLVLVLVILALIIQNARRQRQINKKLEEQAEQLTLLDKMKSRFFANVSHELRTPLTLILGPIKSLLQDKQLTSKQAHLLKMAENSGKQLQQLINEILNLRKLELGKLEVNARPVALSAFFRRNHAQFESLAESKAIQFSLDSDIKEEVVAELDTEKCRQIFHNLLSNAFKFTPNGGEITCNIALNDNHLQLSVSDTGEGIHSEDLPHIFDRYFQTNRPEKMLEGGTGIGLAICKEYVQLFGGEITADSTLGKGTSIRLGFPVSLVEDMSVSAVQPMERSPLANPADLPEKPTVKTNRDAQKKASILVVEDNTDLANYLKIILSEKYEVTTAKNGKIAWDLLLADSDNKLINTYQLILSDLMMPVMNGYELLEKLKSHDATRHLPVVMLTARAEFRDKLQALRIGVDDYLIKPFEEEELLVRIGNLLHRQKAKTATESADEKMTPSISQEDQQWLKEFEQFVRKNISSDILSIPILAAQFSMSEPTLFRQVKRLTGLSPAKYIQEIRLEKALRLLENNTYNSVSKIAYQVGYTDPNSFTRAFKRRFGKTPSKILAA